MELNIQKYGKKEKSKLQQILNFVLKTYRIFKEEKNNQGGESDIVSFESQLSQFR